MADRTLPSDGDLDRAERLASAAIAGNPMDRDLDTGRWEAWFNFHGDPYVVEEGRGQFATVATISTNPEDYGRARAEFIAFADPATVLALVTRLRALIVVGDKLAEAITHWANYDGKDGAWPAGRDAARVRLWRELTGPSAPTARVQADPLSDAPEPGPLTPTMDLSGPEPTA